MYTYACLSAQFIEGVDVMLLTSLRLPDVSCVAAGWVKAETFFADQKGVKLEGKCKCWGEVKYKFKNMGGMLWIIKYFSQERGEFID